MCQVPVFYHGCALCNTLQVYRVTVQPIIPIIFQRTKATCFAYGQTGVSVFLHMFVSVFFNIRYSFIFLVVNIGCSIISSPLDNCCQICCIVLCVWYLSFGRICRRETSLADEIQDEGALKNHVEIFPISSYVVISFI